MSDATSPALDSLHVFAERFQLTLSRQQSLLEDYLLVQAYKPELTFDDFLLGYEGLADRGSPSWPDVAIKTHCADAKAWPVKSRVSLLCVVADALQLLAGQGQPLAMSLSDFVARIAAGVAGGTFALPKPSESLKRSRKRSQTVRNVFTPSEGLRCVYTTPLGFDLPWGAPEGFRRFLGLPERLQRTPGDGLPR